ncbi:MAG TPA: dihydroneopterin aldolase [Gammaproteobacteria bacterium]|jgi:dihydroneopterin aldolase|nr:dihydroneopterin aldolase [Gammaproteobacteria bacterium]
MKPLMSRLSINQLNLFVSLGWPENERLDKQAILMNVDLSYPTPPKACTTDQLQDTVCYSDLIDALRPPLEGKTFHLIEHLAQDAYDILKSMLPSGSLVTVSVLKHPAILGLAGGVTFALGDQA